MKQQHVHGKSRNKTHFLSILLVTAMWCFFSLPVAFGAKPRVTDLTISDSVAEEQHHDYLS